MLNRIKPGGIYRNQKTGKLVKLPMFLGTSISALVGEADLVDDHIYVWLATLPDGNSVWFLSSEIEEYEEVTEEAWILALLAC